MVGKHFKKLLLTLLSFLLLPALSGCAELLVPEPDKTLKVLASLDYKPMDLGTLDSNVKITYMNDIDAVQEINENPDKYDALLVSNSMWTYMLSDSYLTESKSLAVSPVVFGVKMDTAKKLKLIDAKLETKDITKLIEQRIAAHSPTSKHSESGGSSGF